MANNNNTSYGRIKILSDIEPTDDINYSKKVIPLILKNALPKHQVNVSQYIINKEWYYNDVDKILDKTKLMREDINNKFTFSTPRTTIKMNNGYCFGEPFKYVSDEAEEETQKQVQAFSKALKRANCHKHTLICAKNSAIYGIGYKLVTPPSENDLKQGKLFNIISDIDNENAFIVYKNDIEKKPILATMFYERKVVKDGVETGQTETIYNVWTKWHLWKFVSSNGEVFNNLKFPLNIDGVLTYIDAYPLKADINGKAQECPIPMKEFERTDDRVGDFELSIKLMNAINKLACCRLDSVNQAVDYVIKLRDIDVGEFDEKGNNPVLDKIKSFLQNHILAVESREGADAQPDIDVLDIPLNQSEVQMLQDYLMEMLKEELQQPTRSSGTGQDTGIAVENRNGFRDLENNASLITEFAIDNEKDFIDIILSIAQSQEGCTFKDISSNDVKIQSMRNRSENLTNSTNNYREMRKAGVNPYTAYTQSGLVADVNDTVTLDEEWKKKEYDFIFDEEIKKANALKQLDKKYNSDNNIDNKQNVVKNEIKQ